MTARVDPDVVRRMRGGVNPPAPPADRYEVTISHPAHFLRRECSTEEIEAYARAVAPDGWELAELGAPRRVVPGRRDLRVVYRRAAEVSPPWDAEELRDEYDLCGGDWQAVAAALGVPYRELRRWLDHPSLANLEPLWREERRRVQLRDVEGVAREPGARRDPKALRIALGAVKGPQSDNVPALRAAIRMLELYLAAVADEREPYPGVVECLRRAGWIDGPPSR